jgi:hypothetical protein
MQEHRVNVFTSVDGDYDASVAGWTAFVRISQDKRVAADLCDLEHNSLNFETNLDFRRIAFFAVPMHE